LIRFLFASRNKYAECFQDWSSKILFTHQVGTQEQKHTLVKELTGVDVTHAIETLNASASDIACVYLFTIGSVKNLRKSMKIPSTWDDKSYVCKYGETCDLRRRVNEHIPVFEKLGGELRLKHFSFIDVSNTSKAESSLRKRLTDMNVTCTLCGYNELVILDRKQLKETLSIYKELGILYGANINEYKSQTEKRIFTLEHEL
jgi:hypothetical protein